MYNILFIAGWLFKKKKKQVVQSFDANHAISIKAAQEVLKNEQLVNDLVYIQTHFQYLPEIMKKIETRGMSLTESMDIITNTVENIKKVPGKYGKKSYFQIKFSLKKKSWIYHYFENK